MASSDSVEIAKVYFTGSESGDFCMVLGPVNDGQQLYPGQDFWTHFPDKKIFSDNGMHARQVSQLIIRNDDGSTDNGKL